MMAGPSRSPVNPGFSDRFRMSNKPAYCLAGAITVYAKDGNSPVAAHLFEQMFPDRGC
jgi:hypothetical protein